ncbi:MAG: energy-coupling factor transporter transmembrane protein EcfT [Acidimicrobiales bacterium]|nr:energy-coupling factor transporter transmembrane protein EcfT [Acidimicrobiales bacterium]
MRNSLHILRYVEGDSVIHRMNPRAKVLALVLLLLVVSFDASWISVGLLWFLVIGGSMLARLPRQVAPRPPRILIVMMVATITLALLAGGEPYGLGGAILQTRLFAFTLGLLGLSLLVGWTTPTADLPVAAAWLLTPLRWLHVPVDDVVAGLALATRALPLVAEEFTTVISLSRFRPQRLTGPLSHGMDLAATATTATVRRGLEMGEAIEARGGTPTAKQIAHSPGVPDAWGMNELALLGAVAAIIALTLMT